MTSLYDDVNVALTSGKASLLLQRGIESNVQEVIEVAFMTRICAERPDGKGSRGVPAGYRSSPQVLLYTKVER